MTTSNKDNSNSKEPTADNITEVQRQIIESFRATNSRLAQRVEYLEELADEYKTIKNLTAQGMTIQQAQMARNDKMNNINRMKAEQYRYQKEADDATKEATEREAIEKQMTQPRKRLNVKL
jgi:hypothetical protein